MIVQTVNESDFVKAFHDMDREENFTVAARRALFDYYSNLSDSVDNDIKLDVIAICCEWSEYSEDELINQYIHLVDMDDIDQFAYDGDGERLNHVIKVLGDYTIVLEVKQIYKENTFLVMEF